MYLTPEEYERIMEQQEPNRIFIMNNNERVEWVRSGEGEELIPGMVVSRLQDEPLECSISFDPNDLESWHREQMQDPMAVRDDYREFQAGYPDPHFTRERFEYANSFIKVGICSHLDIMHYPESETVHMKDIRFRMINLQKQRFISGSLSISIQRNFELEQLLERFQREHERVSTEQQRLMSEMIEVQGDYLEAMQHAMQAQVSCRFVDCHEIKKAPIDRLYPHSCQNENCKRPLKFKELVIANGNIVLEDNFMEKIRIYLKENYEQFDYTIRNEWAIIIGKFEYRQYLRKLYKNPDIKFFCCSCARKAEDNDWEMIVKEGKVYLERKKTDQQKKGDDQITFEINHAWTDHEIPSHEPFNPTLEELTEQLRQDLYEGTGLTREQLFGSEQDDQ